MEEQESYRQGTRLPRKPGKVGKPAQSSRGELRNISSPECLNSRKAGETDSEEYADLSRKSKGLQDIIDKWRPIYLRAHGNGEKRTDEKA